MCFPEQFQFCFKPRTRRLFCGLVVGVDESVGIVVNALKEAGMLDNTIIMYSSDNGGVPYSGGNNRPFRYQNNLH